MVKLLTKRKRACGLGTVCGLGRRAGSGLAEKERVEGAAEIGEPHRRGAGNP